MHETRVIEVQPPGRVLPPRVESEPVRRLPVAAALRVTKPDAPRPFKIPGGKLGLALVIGAGVVGALFTFFLGFIPATHLSAPGTIAYVAVMAFGMIAIVGTPFLLHRGPSLRSNAQKDPHLLAASTPGRV